MPAYAIRLRLGMAIAVSLLSAMAGAQTLGSGTIAGVVRDSTGGVLPGVTVEASSPALIEKVRSVVSDDQGRYQVIDLRPGTYTVVFSLAGFGTVRREGIQLTTGFTATVNADLTVGGVAETITVSGASPIVDTQNVRRAEVLSNEILEVLPTSKSMNAFRALAIGVSGANHLQDVGGNYAQNNVSLVIHNTRPGDSHWLMDGMNTQWSLGVGGGGNKLYYPNPMLSEEVVLETSGIGAESEVGGVQINAVPKDGGNTFRGTFNINYTNEHLQSSNLDDGLRARGISLEAKTKRAVNQEFGFGGPLKRDRLWFYAAEQAFRTDNYAPGNYYNATLGTLFYTPDLTRQAFLYHTHTDGTARFTWQATEKNKFTFMESYQTRCECLRSIDAGVAPEAGYDYYANPLSMTQATWSYPMTARVLVQAGFSLGIMHANIQRPIDGTETHIGVTDLGLGYSYGSRPGVSVVSPGYTNGDFQTSRFSIAYVTGSHNFKVGFSNYFGWLDRLHEANNVAGLGTVRYTFRNQVPVAVEYLATPQTGKERGSSIGLYAQDQWTLRRLTLNLGVRFDHMDQWVPAQTRPAGFFTPEFRFEKIDVVNWNDIAPRLGAAFDLFGTGKTAVKASIGRYVQGDVNTIAGNNNPAYTVVTSATRAWSDANGDYFPQESELGPLSNSAFGTLTSNQRYDRALLEGWGARPHNWQVSAQVQQELAPGIGLLAGYFRTWYGSIHTTDNLRITPTDFDPFCVTAPIDARLAGGGGNQICGFYDLAPTAFGAVDNFVTSDSNFGGRTEIFHGVDIALSARFGRGGQLSGGVSTGQTTFNDCAVVDNPAGFNPTPTVAARPRRFCETTNPWRGQTQFKLNGVYPLPWDLQLSGIFQSLPGAPIDANYPATNAEIARTLGRNLGACGAAAVCQATAVVQLIERFSEFEDRLYQTDLRLTRGFPIGRARLNAQFDVYNVFNANTILAVNPAFGRVWPRPTAVLSARTFKLGAQLDF